tara:strand:+ start:80 stop:1204 length:1125 start_codon:yes stop_codon:yes gene_type:complete
MSKKLIIFGNGLGMALNPDHFLLTNAMTRVWDCPTRLSVGEKTTLGSLKGIETATGPKNEDELATAQVALAYLSSFRAELGDEALSEWFKEDALNYPGTLNKYVFEVAYELYSYLIPEEQRTLWKDFLTSLTCFIRDTRSHIATLNYDDLLYAPFVDGHHFIEGGKTKWLCLTKKDPESSNIAPYLRDGFFKGAGQTLTAFTPDSFNWAGDCGYYLHLHGSPLYVSDTDARKLNRSEVATSTRTLRRHIVLANRKDKETIIRRSEILSDYWDNRLPKCIADAEEIILFGYSGLDLHLNELIRDKHDGPIHVVEWSGSTHYPLSTDENVLEHDPISAKEFWGSVSVLSVPEANVHRMKNILEFREWSNPDDCVPF